MRNKIKAVQKLTDLAESSIYYNISTQLWTFSKSDTGSIR